MKNYPYPIKSENVILDDGMHFLEENCNDRPGIGNIFLNKRLQHNQHKWDCVGGVDAVDASRKTWSASINKPYEEENDKMILIQNLYLKVLEKTL